MKVAFLFPGQGSQKVGMGADLYENMEAARAMFDRADASLGFELSTLCFHGPEEDLRQTINTQPALYVTSCAALEALRSRFDEDFVVEPFAVAGHSVGEPQDIRSDQGRSPQRSGSSNDSNRATDHGH